MKRTELYPGINITELVADKFRRCRVSVNFVMPAARETATAYALLPYLMERGYEDCPDMTAMAIKLASLYGADVSVDSTMNGANRVLTVSVSGIKDDYAADGEKLSAEYAKLLLGVAFRPFFEDGLFPADATAIEKGKLKNLLEGERNNKRSYCIRQARRKFFKQSANGIEANGYIDEIDDLSTAQLTVAYHNMVQTAQIEVIVLGADTEAVKGEILAFFKDKKRSYNCAVEPFSEPETPHEQFFESINAVQGKVCAIYNVGEILTPEQGIAMRLAISLYGALPTSRLFMNVREKQSLCYYCAATFSSMAAMVTVDSGVEFANAEKTLTAIDEELKRLQTTPVGDEELQDAKRQVLNQLTVAGDLLYSIESWNLGSILRRDFISIEQAIDIIKNTDAEQVRLLLCKLQRALTYTLTNNQAEEK